MCVSIFSAVSSRTTFLVSFFPRLLSYRPFIRGHRSPYVQNHLSNLQKCIEKVLIKYRSCIFYSIHSHRSGFIKISNLFVFLTDDFLLSYFPAPCHLSMLANLSVGFVVGGEEGKMFDYDKSIPVEIGR